MDTSTFQRDFDRIAKLTACDWNHNNEYHRFLLQFLPANCDHALEIGCGTGSLSRELAKRSRNVTAIDLSPEMISIAKAQSVSFANIEFEVGDFMQLPLAREGFDCIATIATLHHLPFTEALLRFKTALKPGGVLLVLDLYKLQGLRDGVRNLVAFPVGGALRVIRGGRLHRSASLRAAWKEHESHDTFPTMSEVREACFAALPGAIVKTHLLWRYSLVWRK